MEEAQFTMNSKASSASDGDVAKEPVSRVCFVCNDLNIICLQQMNVDDAEDPGSNIDEDWERVTLKNATESRGAQPAVGDKVGDWFVQRSKFIPLRLTLPERKFLRLLEAALTVSEYTDKIDTIGFGMSKTKRIVHQIRELCAIMSGLLLSADYKMGQELFSGRDFQANAEFYQTVFELGRRHKIMSPDKMRTTYGKLIYMLQVRPACPGTDLNILKLYVGQPSSRSRGTSKLLVCKAYPNGFLCTG